jgi:uncharacterized protein YbjT (DUF2867 family)
LRVFVTGATGFVGAQVVAELIGAGHGLLGLARGEDEVGSLAATGADAHRGTLGDLESLRSGAADSEAVIHLGFGADFSKFKESCETDRGAIEALGSAIAGTAKRLIVPNGIGIETARSISNRA